MAQKYAKLFAIWLQMSIFNIIIFSLTKAKQQMKYP